MAENIDVVVRARDEASKTLSEVSGSVQKLTNRMTMAGGLVAGGLAAVGTFKLVKGFADKASAAYLDQEKAARGLSDGQRAFSANLQDVLAVQDEATNAAMKQAKSLGVQEGQLESVTKAAIGLSEITGQSLASAMFKVNEAVNGNAGALASYIPALRDASTEEEKLALVSEFASKGLDKQLSKSRSIEGAIDRRNASMQDLYATIGEIVKPSEKFQNTISAMAKISAEVIESIASNFKGGSGIISQALEGARISFVATVAAWDTVSENLQDSWELITATFELSIEIWVSRFRHAFTEVVPKLAIWFAENFVNILRDGAVGAVTIIQNMGKNLGEAVFAIMQWIESGFAGGMDGLGAKMGDALFVGLLDGFEAHTESLPDIIGRQISGREKYLEKRVADLGASLGGKFNENFQDRMKQFGDIMKGFGGDFDTDLALEAAAGAALDKKKGGGGQQNRDLAAVESRLLTRGPREDRTDQMVRFLANIARSTKKIEANTEDSPEDASARREGLQVEMVP